MTSLLRQKFRMKKAAVNSGFITIRFKHGRRWVSERN